MKLNSQQFKRKSQYFLPFFMAYYFFKCGREFVYKLDILFIDGHRECRYVYPVSFVFKNVRSALVTRFDKISFNTEWQFFVSFLASCNYRQLASFICLVRDTYSLYVDIFQTSFMSDLPNIVGDNLFRSALDYANRK